MSAGAAVKIELLNGPLLEDLLAGVGILDVPILGEVPETAESIQTKLALIAANNGPVFYVSTNNPPQFFNRGVMRHQKRPGRPKGCWPSHAGAIEPEGWAREVRARYPELLRPRAFPESLTKLKVLPAVPAEVRGMEVVESQAKVAIADPAAVVKHGEFVVAFLRDWTDGQALAISRALYWLYGAPYDVWEIGRKIWPIWPKFRQIFVCSSLQTYGARGQDPNLDDDDPANIDRGDPEIWPWMLAHALSPEESTPSEFGQYLFGNPKFRPIAFWCDAEQARSLV